MKLPESARECAALVRRGDASALEITNAVLADTAERDCLFNSHTAILADRARAAARTIDKARAGGATLPPLAGVPYAVKNLFDIAGLATLALLGACASTPAPVSVGDAIARFRHCPQCGGRGLTRERSTVTGATRSASGVGSQITRCTHCSYEERATYTIPRIRSGRSGGGGGGFGAAAMRGRSRASRGR